jgi:hypothetical protein
MGESQWEQCRRYLDWPSRREVQGARRELMDVVVPMKHVLAGRRETLAAMVEVVRTLEKRNNRRPGGLNLWAFLKRQ